MITTRQTSVRTAAMVLLLVVQLSIGCNIASFYQTEYQIAGPLIPKDTVLFISRPYLFAALVAIPVTIAALLCFFFSRYIWVIVLCSAILIWQYSYVHWGF